MHHPRPPCDHASLPARLRATQGGIARPVHHIVLNLTTSTDLRQGGGVAPHHAVLLRREWDTPRVRRLPAVPKRERFVRP